MADSFAVVRYRAMLHGRRPGPPPKLVKPFVYDDDERARMLIKAVTMHEIHAAAELLGLSFKEAYAERKRLYKERWGI
jgi:hypothetical protein